MDLSQEHIEKITGKQLRALQCHEEPPLDVYDMEELTVHDDFEDCEGMDLEEIWFMIGYLEAE